MIPYQRGLARYRQHYQQLEPLLQKPKNAAYTMAILSLVTISFFGVFAIRPTVTTIASLRREIADKRFVSAQLDAKIAALLRAQTAYQTVQTDLPLIYRSIPQTPEFPRLLKQIEGVTQEFGATLSAANFSELPLNPNLGNPSTPSATASAQPAKPVLFNISLDADYQRITQFIERLLNIDRLIIIRQITIAQGSTTDEALNLQLQLQSFYLP